MARKNRIEEEQLLADEARFNIDTEEEIIEDECEGEEEEEGELDFSKHNFRGVTDFSEDDL